MDDTCVVCAESLEWVAYGPCGHREVCSTCVARLRFICEDHRCCLCKSESKIIFVTKALGDYTRMINDFSVLPDDPIEGRIGPYWYHEDTQAYFDDSDHYKMIKEMCRLSCSVCDRMDEQAKEGSKRKGMFKNVEQLRGHLFHRHQLFMCGLCLGGRKIFMCERKLYTRSQLRQHIKTGDSEVDGSESERGGFAGHPTCEFCQSPFYGDHELYLHMSTEHYTCHICQRLHPGQYEYYKNYDDLEKHFRCEHCLCEDEGCLAKKFVVFATESEIKRHNAIEHGGRMSRSKRNATLQIPTSFRYRRNNEQDPDRRGQHGVGPKSSDQLLLAIQASFETANADSFHNTVSGTQAVPSHREKSGIDSIPSSFESLTTTDAEPSSRYRQVVGQGSCNLLLEESSFPPLPMVPSNSKQKFRKNLKGPGRNAMAAHLRHQNTVNVLNSSNVRPAARRQPISFAGISSHSRPTSNSELLSSSGFASASLSKPVTANRLVSSSHANSAQARPPAATGLASVGSTSSSQNLSSTSKVGLSALAPNDENRASFDSSTSNFPLVSSTQTKTLSASRPSTQLLLKAEDVHAANESLVERIRAALGFDEDKYAAFKIISSEYCQGVIDMGEYLAYVHQFGLSHLVLELARLCPDAQKQKELVEVYNSSIRRRVLDENSVGNDSVLLKNRESSKKGKEKCEDNGISSSKRALADSMMGSVRMPQSSYRPSEEVEVLSKDGYRSSKGKSKVVALSGQQGSSGSGSQSLAESRSQNDSKSASVDLKKNLGTGGEGHKLRKKMSKFHRLRLGDDSPASLLELGNSYPTPAPTKEKSEEIIESSDGLPACGVWKNGGGKKLVAMTQRNRIK